MSLVHLSNLCSHLSNASLARLAITSTPYTTQLHTLLLQMQKHGYVATVAVAGPLPPPPTALSPVMGTRVPRSYGADDGVGGDTRIAGVDRRLRDGDGEMGGSEEMEMGMEEDETVVTQSNISTRRVWVGLKYFKEKRVLEKMEMVSKPTRRVWMGVPEMEGLLGGDRVGYVRGLRGVGEAVFATTDRGIMEVRECVERRVGGMLLVRVNGVGFVRTGGKTAGAT